MGGEPMSLGALLGTAALQPEPVIMGVCMDSRRLRPGDLFLAVPGRVADGRDFIAAAAAAGAAAIAVPDAIRAADEAAAGDVPIVAVPDLARQVGHVAARYLHQPSRALRVLGVTGTNGKTSCTYHLMQMLDALGERAGICGTLGVGLAGHLRATGLTTPDPVTVQQALAGLRDAGARWVAMEVSSHALDQERVGAVAFEGALFTNLTRDHLDYHGSMAAYGEAKRKLFLHEGLAMAAINIDDPFGEQLVEHVPAPVDTLTYSLRQEHASVRVLGSHLVPHGFEARITTPWGDGDLRAPLLGEFGLSNLLGGITLLLAAGLPLSRVLQAATAVTPVAGRMQCFDAPSGATVVVDYAHTPDALERALMALHLHFSGRVLCVFGCGGERDRGKRPAMGRVVEAHADAMVITDDNPRGEDGDAIIAEIRSGIGQRIPVHVERDRAAAIGLALAEAGPDDVVLVAGKGHEDYQDGAQGRRAYSDIDTVRMFLEAAAAAQQSAGGR